MTFKSLFGKFTILSLSFVTFRVSRFHVSHLTYETFKLGLQNTLNMSKTTRVCFGVLQEHKVYRYMFKVYRYMPPESAQNVCFCYIFPYFDTQINYTLQTHIQTIPYISCNLFSTQFLFQNLSFLKIYHEFLPKPF